MQFNQCISLLFFLIKTDKPFKSFTFHDHQASYNQHCKLDEIWSAYKILNSSSNCPPLQSAKHRSLVHLFWKCSLYCTFMFPLGRTAFIDYGCRIPHFRLIFIQFYLFIVSWTYFVVVFKKKPQIHIDLYTYISLTGQGLQIWVGEFIAALQISSLHGFLFSWLRSRGDKSIIRRCRSQALCSVKLYRFTEHTDYLFAIVSFLLAYLSVTKSMRISWLKSITNTFPKIIQNFCISGS